jgi:hypothetical protein
MGFNRRKMESERAAKAAKEAEARRALGPQILADAEKLIASWNARQEAHMPMLFSPTIGAAIAARRWFLWVRCPACQSINVIDLRTLDRHPDAAITSLVPWLSCRSCRPHAPFAELVRLSSASIADEMHEARRRRASGE